MHIFQNKNTIGQRLLISNGYFGKQDIINVLNKNSPQLKGNNPPRNTETDIASDKGRCVLDTSKTRAILKFPFKNLDQTITETVAQSLKKNNVLSF